MQLFAVDIDGTCLNPKQQVSRRTLDALRHVAKAGIEIVPATGRTQTCLPSVLKDEPYIRYIITSNGARVTGLHTGKTLFKAPIPRKDAVLLLEDCQKKKLGITAHIDDEYFVQGRLLYLLGRLTYGSVARNSKRVKDILAYAEGKNISFDELQFFFFSDEARQSARVILSNYDLFAVYSEKYVEVFSKSANKGTALSALTKRLAIPQNQVACIGDGENDLFLFQAAGLKFAMGNAAELLKVQADHIVAPNQSDGVAEAIEQYLL